VTNKRLILFLLLAAAGHSLAQASSANEVGSISGIVNSVEDGKPLLGVNVVVQNTVLGAATDADGKFHIEGIPQGTYALAFSMIGYSRKVVGDIKVAPRKTTSVVAELFPLPVQTAPVVVTATNHEESMSDVPVSVDVVDAKTIMELSPTSVKDVLQYVPGVRMLEDQVDIRGYTGYSLGVGSRVLLLMDGMPLLTGDMGEIVWEMIPVDQVERVEVVKGAASALYGSSALGGVINIITRDIPSAPETNFRIYSGLYDEPYYPEWKWSNKPRGLEGFYANHSQRFGSFGILASGGYGADNGFRENDSYRRWNGFAKLEYDFSPFEQLKLVSSIVHQNQATFYYWNGLNDPLQPEPAQENAQTLTTRWNTDLLFKGFSGDRFSYNIKGQLFSSFLHYDSASVGNATSLANTANLEAQGAWDSKDNYRLTFGAVGNIDRVIALYYGTHLGLGGAAYLQGEFDLTSPLRLNVGFRYDIQEIVGLPPWERLSPKIGLVFSASATTTLRASVGGGFRAPSLAELYINEPTPYLPIVPNIGLKPEQSWSFEIGGTQSFSDAVMLDCALYQSNFSDLIEAGFDSTGGKLKIKFGNVTRARVQGAEVDMKTDLFQRFLHLDFGYTYTWPIDLTTGQVMRYRSRQLFYSSASVNYDMFSAGVNFRYISKMMSIDDLLQAFIADWNAQVPVEVVDARASINMAHLGIPITVGFHVNNLFQYNYVELPGNLGPIRNFVLSVEGRL
jgi:outer membrane receptor for ferrienterochelin and colicins